MKTTICVSKRSLLLLFLFFFFERSTYCSLISFSRRRAKGSSFNMSIAVLQIGIMQTNGTVTSFMLNESTGKLFLRLQDAVEHDGSVPNLRSPSSGLSGEKITTHIPIDKLINWIISSGYKLHTVLPSVYDGNCRRSPEKYIFEKVFG